jgi:hypothetical protein
MDHAELKENNEQYAFAISIAVREATGTKY